MTPGRFDPGISIAYGKNRSIGVDADTYRKIEILANGESIRSFMGKLINNEYRKRLSETSELDDMIAELEHSSSLLENLLRAWHRAFPGGKPATLSDGLSMAIENFPDLASALVALDDKSGGDIDNLNLMRLAQKMPLRNGQSDVVSGLRMRSMNSRERTKLYWVEEV